MKVFPERLEQALARELRPAYLIAGPEHLLIQEASDAVRRAARRHEVHERIELVADSGFDWSELAHATESGSLFASRRLVEVRLPGGTPGVEGAKAIRAWLEENRDDVLLLICLKWELKQEKSVWVRAVEQAGLYVPAWTVKAAQLPGWISRRLKSRGLRADAALAAFLASRFEGNLLAAAQEIDRLALLYPDGRLDRLRVERAVADHARFGTFRMAELVMSGQGGAALRSIRGLRESAIGLPAIVGVLAAELQTLRQLTVLSKRMSLAAAFRELRIWESKQAPLRAALGRLNRDDLNRALADLTQLDRYSKGRFGPDLASGSPQLFWIRLEQFCVRLATGTRHAA